MTCVTAYPYDSTKICSDISNDVNGGPPFPPNCFDKVLLDAPCSGLGQRPQLVNKLTPKMIQSYKFVQQKLLCAVGSFLFCVHLYKIAIMAHYYTRLTGHHSLPAKGGKLPSVNTKLSDGRSLQAMSTESIRCGQGEVVCRRRQVTRCKYALESFLTLPCSNK